jgi:hypothetical protein
MAERCATADRGLRVAYFTSYAHHDFAIADSLARALAPNLASSRTFTYSGWRDTGILLGEDWDTEITQAAEACDAGLLLLSPSFLSRPYIVERELPRLLADGKVVLPVLLKPIDMARHAMHGLDRLQIFARTVGGKRRAFSEERRASDREQFALELFGQIEQRIANSVCRGA